MLVLLTSNQLDFSLTVDWFRKEQADRLARYSIWPLHLHTTDATLLRFRYNLPGLRWGLFMGHCFNVPPRPVCNVE